MRASQCRETAVRRAKRIPSVPAQLPLLRAPSPSGGIAQHTHGQKAMSCLPRGIVTLDGGQDAASRIVSSKPQLALRIDGAPAYCSARTVRLERSGGERCV